MIRRREFIAGIGAAALPLAARAQQADRVRHLAVLLGTIEDDRGSIARLAAFRRRLMELGWVEGRNLRLDVRFAAGDRDIRRKYVAELVGLKPDVIVAQGASMVALFQQASRSAPIVFAEVTDPVAAGLVENLARPGTNATGATLFEYGLAAKWLGLLKQIMPAIERAGIFRDPSLVSGGGQFGAIQAMAPSLGIEAVPLDVREADAIERSISGFAVRPNGGLIVTASDIAFVHSTQIISLAAQHRLPAVYPARLFVTDGGLLCYGPDIIEQFRLAAAYVDRILKGERPADLPVQAPTKFDLAINLKTAQALGLTVPETLLATADEVIR
jgi:putative ABC transport system substrate-binding protein